MSGNRITALIIVAVIHLVVGYALITGLAYEGVRQIMKKVTTVDIKKEEDKKPPPPPPPKKELPPPIVAPPVRINIAPAPPQIETVSSPPPAPPPIVLAPPPAAPPPSQARSASPKNQGSWAARIQENYPGDALRAEKQGRVGVHVTIGPDGRVSSCNVTSSSGTSSLDSAACDGMLRYGRYTPALDAAGSPTTGVANTAIVYRLNN
jgi:protein TonB